MSENLAMVVLYLLHSFFGGALIKLAIDYFKGGKYYWFGVSLLNTIVWVFFMLKAMCSILN